MRPSVDQTSNQHHRPGALAAALLSSQVLCGSTPESVPVDRSSEDCARVSKGDRAQSSRLAVLLLVGVSCCAAR
jgi:hypothetical protein